MPSYLSPGVYVEEVPSGSASLSAGATAIAAFVGFTEKAPKDDPTDPDGLKPRLVTSWAQFESLFGGFTPGAMLPHSVYGWFNNGGAVCYIVRIAHTAPSEEPGQLALPAADRAIGNVIDVESKGAAEELSIAVTANIDNDGDDAEPTFDLIVLKDGVVVESYEGLTVTPKAENNAATATKASEYVTVAVADMPADLDDLTLAMPKPGTYPVKTSPATPIQVKAPAFAGSETARRGINGLAIAEDVTIVAVPDLITAAPKDDGTVDLGHVEERADRADHPLRAAGQPDGDPRFPAGDVRAADQGVAQRHGDVRQRVRHAVLPVDQARQPDPRRPATTRSSSRRPATSPACGRAPTTPRGVWKAPANDTLRGVLSLERDITMAEQGLLNPIGINCIRPFGTRGIRVWGARTLSSDTDWRYINVRRLFNMIETAIMQGTQWAVFEPNDLNLWEGVKRTLNAFLRGLWRDGALFGATPEQAFFVKCDAETNPPDSIDEGKLVVEVGIAPVKPAEFVIFRISQFKDNAA